MDDEKKGQKRTTGFPSIPFPKAMEYMVLVMQKHGASEVTAPVLAKTLKFAISSKGRPCGPAMQAVASLKQFGMLERTGKGTVRATNDAIHAVKNRDAVLLGDLALRPEVFKQIRSRFPTDLPPTEDDVDTFLMTSGKHWGATARKQCRRAYLSTIPYILEAARIRLQGAESSEEDQETTPAPNDNGTMLSHLGGPSMPQAAQASTSDQGPTPSAGRNSTVPAFMPPGGITRFDGELPRGLLLTVLVYAANGNQAKVQRLEVYPDDDQANAVVTYVQAWRDHVVSVNAIRAKFRTETSVPEVAPEQTVC